MEKIQNNQQNSQQSEFDWFGLRITCLQLYKIDILECNMSQIQYMLEQMPQEDKSKWNMEREISEVEKQLRENKNGKS